MAINPVSSITRAATRSPDEPLNILTFVTHERYEPNLCKTNHNFYAITGNGIRNWNTQYAPIPENYHILDGRLEDNLIPVHLDIDVVLCQNVMAHYPLAHQFAQIHRLPLVNLWHLLPPTDWTQDEFNYFTSLDADVDVFISEYNKEVWNKPNGSVIYHGMDTDFWKPSQVERKQHALSVVNDWINRDWCCGFSIWNRVTQNLPTHVIGDTPGLSEPSESLESLRDSYCEAQVFVNTSTHSPIPCSLLEAMSCGCAVVSTATCLIPEIIENGVNGFLSNDEDELRQYTVDLLNDPELAAKMGEEARRTIEKVFNMDRFVSEWNSVLRGVADYA